MLIKTVPGTNRGDVMLYALSTCGWCAKTKRLLSDLGVEYRYVDVDLLTGDDRTKAINEVKKWNPLISFPTMVIDNEHCIKGFDKNKIEELLGRRA